MANVTTKASIEAMQEYINSITLSTYYLVSKRGKLTFISSDDETSGGPNNIELFVANSPSDLKTVIDSETASSTLVDVIQHGLKYIVIVDATSTTALTSTVTVYDSVETLKTGLGVEVETGRDGTEVIEGVNDTLLSYGGRYTLVRDTPTNTIVIQNGLKYTVIEY